MDNSSGSPETERQLFTLPDGSPRWLTPDEALDEGFCPMCGAFVAGIDAEIPSITRYQMCSECLDELREETGEFDGDYEDF